MSYSRFKSLRWTLTFKIILAQGIALVILGIALIFLQALSWYNGNLYYGTNEYATIDAIANSIADTDRHELKLQPTSELQEYIKTRSDFWFIVQNVRGDRITYGQPPESVKPAISAIGTIAYADLVQDINKSEAPVATIQWAESKAGNVKIMTSSRVPVTFGYALKVASIQSFTLLVILLLIVIIVVPLTIPLVVKKTLARMNQASEEAKLIAFEKDDIRLSSEGVFSDVQPFIDAVNGALNRLEKSYNVQKQFLSDAAHELRTPVAIIGTRVSILPAGEIKNKLLSDTARLTVLTNKLLDLQRYENIHPEFESVDLIMLVEKVVGEIAPLAVNAGYDISLDTCSGSLNASIDSIAIEQALRNLLQNAINYGGQKGIIRVKVSGTGSIEVSDEGEGIPVSEHKNVFQPFHRLKNDGHGTGLGLALVDRIMKTHNGTVEVVLVPDNTGTCIRLNLTRCLV